MNLHTPISATITEPISPPIEHPDYPLGQNNEEIAQPLSELPYLHQTIQVLSQNMAAQFSRRQLAFIAKSCIINNLTGRWFWAPFLRAYIPPYVVNMIFNIPSGSQVAGFTQETPTTFNSTAVSGEIFNATFFSIEQAPMAGIQIPPTNPI